jgi:hypothetical protein
VAVQAYQLLGNEANNREGANSPSHIEEIEETSQLSSAKKLRYNEPVAF